jgi:hypothetical protein
MGRSEAVVMAFIKLAVDGVVKREGGARAWCRLAQDSEGRELRVRSLGTVKIEYGI